MVGQYHRKTDRQLWSKESMGFAIEAVQDGRMGWLAASKQFNVPQATLRRRAQGKNKQVRGVDKGLGRFCTTFPKEMELDLVEHIKSRENVFVQLFQKKWN
ncbi:CENP-B N-terminal DNA-binding domain [Popillia japonica]|uniref:CENP-B N-terminal DNA-binding domain n=1 Tax=Popillia japonica TaxID=7064 RepID=A0AAW1L9E5_POPJA